MEGLKTKLVKIFLFSLILFVFLFLPSTLAQEEYSCIDITPVTTFHDGDSSETLVIAGGSSDTSAKILVPIDLELYSASLDITGQHIENESAMDIVVVNDISGSMIDNLTSMQADTKGFIDLLLAHTYNKGGLISFNGSVVDEKALTGNKEELFDIVDNYEIEPNDTTCLVCGIERGIDLLRERATPVRAMVLFANGEANRCTYGVCTDPKGQAINRAEQAWLYYGIKVYVLPYSGDSDFETLQVIADEGHGVLFDVGTPMSEVYANITENFTGSPSDVSLDVGDDGDSEFSQTGEFLGTESVNFTSELRDILPECDCEGCEISGENCLIDLRVSSATTGVVVLDNLLITGCINTTVEDNDEDGYNSTVDCNDSDPNVHPGAEEMCNGIDDDCDGTVDEELVRSCYTGPPGTEGVGICHAGMQTCAEGEWGACEGEITPQPPACNGKDNNCNGRIDDGYDIDCGGGGTTGAGGGRRGGIYCGDGACNGIETCETCEEDCGECCKPSWTCSDWGECSQENLQTRICTDENECGTSENKPSEIQACTYTPPAPEEGTQERGCGNGVCESDETCETCEEDCGSCPPSREAEVTPHSPAGGAGLLGMFTAGQATGGGLLALLVIILGILLFYMKRKKQK